jgi:hypothetical protein
MKRAEYHRFVVPAFDRVGVGQRPDTAYWTRAAALDEYEISHQIAPKGKERNAAKIATAWNMEYLGMPPRPPSCSSDDDEFAVKLWQVGWTMPAPRPPASCCPPGRPSFLHARHFRPHWGEATKQHAELIRAMRHYWQTKFMIDTPMLIYQWGNMARPNSDQHFPPELARLTMSWLSVPEYMCKQLEAYI